jgi:2-oxoglutarate dehydrogenase complex dehydrogenase (E1) component-like enzyme
MGAWPTMAIKLPEALGRPVGHLALPASSAPAAGSAAAHVAGHQKLVNEALLAD